MRTIHKFTLPVRDIVSVEMPTTAKILHIGHQPGDGPDTLRIWAEVDTDFGMKEDRVFYIVGTGNPMPTPRPGWGMDHRASVIVHPFVWHVYEQVR